MGNIIGWGHNKFGRNDTQTTEDMISEVVSEASETTSEIISSVVCVSFLPNLLCPHPIIFPI